MLRLDGKIALVTGCGSQAEGWGNGKAIAVQLARQGATVFGVDRNLEAANVTRDIVESEGHRMLALACDVTDGLAVAEMVRHCADTLGGIDILVNNVGQSEPGEPVGMSEDVWREQLDTNLTSAFLTCKHVIPIMVECRSGSIVNIASVAGMRWTGKDQVAYAAAKAGLMQFTKVTAIAYALSGIRLNCVVPGLMFTPLVQRLAQRYAAGDYEGMVARRHAQVPMGHMGDAWDVANAAVFLASDEARYMTGTELVVDGGLTAFTGKS